MEAYLYDLHLPDASDSPIFYAAFESVLFLPSRPSIRIIDAVAAFRPSNDITSRLDSQTTTLQSAQRTTQNYCLQKSS